MSLEEIKQLIDKIDEIRVPFLLLIIANISTIIMGFGYLQHSQITKMMIDDVMKDTSIDTIEKIELIGDIRDEAADEYRTLTMSLLTLCLCYLVVSNE